MAESYDQLLEGTGKKTHEYTNILYILYIAIILIMIPVTETELEDLLFLWKCGMLINIHSCGQ